MNSTDPSAPAGGHAGEDAAPPSPAASLQLIDEQKRAARRRLDIDPALMLVPWGVAWLVGYGLFFLRFGPDERVFVSMPEWLPLTVLLGLLCLAGAISGVAGVRAQHGVAGESAERGTMYGLSWMVGFSTFVVLASRFDDLLPDRDAGLLWASLPVLVTAILYMSGGAVWRDRYQFGLGVWLSVANVAGLLAGPGWHFAGDLPGRRRRLPHSRRRVPAAGGPAGRVVKS